MANIQVRHPQTEKLLLTFQAPKDAQGVLEAMRDKTGQRGVLLSEKTELGGLAYIGSDSLRAGTYYWHVAGKEEHEQSAARATPGSSATRMRQLAAVFVALVTLGLVVQLAILGIALPFCDHNWHCAHGWYKAFISHIDGPFKILTFWTAIRAAQAHPDRWLNTVGLDWWFAGWLGDTKKRLSKANGSSEGEGANGGSKAVGENEEGREERPRKGAGGMERRKGFKQVEADDS